LLYCSLDSIERGMHCEKEESNLCPTGYATQDRSSCIEPKG
jgi:hypothetical protein